MSKIPADHGMDPVTVTELNQQTKSILNRVKAGETVPVTERGKIVAFLTPPPPLVTGDAIIDQWIAEGRLIPPEVPGGITDLLPVPQNNRGTGNSLTEEVLRERNRESSE